MRTSLRIVTALVAASLCGSWLGAQSPTPGLKLLVLSKGDLTLAVVDPATLAVRGHAPSGPDPHEVAASTDGRTAYIANYNGGGNVIHVIDLTTMTPRPPIDLGPLRAPHGLMFVGGKLWFTAEGAKAIGRYDPATSKVDWILGTGQNRTHMLFVFPDMQRIVTSNVSSGTITIAQLGPVGGPAGPPPGGPARGASAPAAGGRGPGAPGPPQSDWNETVIPVGQGAEGFDVTPDGRQVWAANAGDGTISVIDIATKKVTHTLQTNVASANRLKFTPDGKLALVSLLNGPDLVVVDVATRTPVKRVPIGHGAAGIEMAPDGQRAYVSCTPDDYVAVIDLKTLTVAGHIAAGRQPDGLAWVRMP